ncbi:hypothetical protein [Jannaschia ovalis]|uniref:Uncharacterized protein n=1 Tax=Jannaschia ovalis TaxID=3038773 RepID=A0ABY8L9C6_9RHOB|nr:hypothetical protein [Jannaschia sp. GRR-S6-38]WGH77901.1 hypothetical protein P8627_12775 [Jannaschia sp. GRR-S6-38]
MSREQFQTDWRPFAAGLMTRYPELTDGDLAEADGSTARLAKIIAEKQGTAPEDAQQRLHEFLGGPMPADAYADPTRDNMAARDSGDYVADGEDALADDRRFGDDHTPDTPMGRKQ